MAADPYACAEAFPPLPFPAGDHSKPAHPLQPITILFSGFFLALGLEILGGVVLLFGALLDAIDGELARVLHQESPIGGFFDSLSDPCGDFAVCLGLLCHFLIHLSPGGIVLTFMALFGSMLGSQARSRAAMLGIDTKAVGIFTRFERMLILVVGLLAGEVIPALWILAVFNNFSAIQRIIHIIRVPFSPEKLAR
jgi:phosphatidylglycerophosphate synthase